MKKLPASLKSLDGLDKAYHEAYEKQEDGTFALQLDGLPVGFVDRKTHNEFVENNKRLFAENEGYKKRYDGIDPEKVRTLQEENAALKGKVDKKELVPSTEVQDLERRLAQKYDPLITENERLQQELRKGRVIDKLRTAALSAGVQQKGVDDLLAIVAGEWDEENGQLTRKVNGQPAYSDDKPATLQTPQEFFIGLAKEKPWFYAPSNGDGAPPSDGPKKDASGKIIVNGNDPREMGLHAEAIDKGEAVVKY